MRKVIAGVVLSCCSLALAALSPGSSPAQSAPTAKATAAVHDGEQVFSTKCMQCHALHEGQYSFGPNLAGEMKKTPKRTTVGLRTIIVKGKGKMPGFEDKLTKPEIDNLLAYIRTL